MMALFAIIIYVNNLLTTIIGILANITVLVLAFFVRDHNANDVRMSLAAHAVTDLTLTIVYTALQLGVVIQDGTAILLIIGPITQLVVWISRCLFTIFCFLIKVNIMLLPIGFLYRYVIICRKDHLMHLFTWRYFVPICVALVLYSISLEAMLQPFLHFWKGSIKSGEYKDLGDPILIDIQRGAGPILLAYCVLLCVTAVLSYALVIFCAQQTFKMLTAATLSDPTRRLQKEVTTGMILQAVLPLVFNTLPMVCLLFLIISPIEIDCYGTLLFALLYWQPCVHPLLSLYFVRPFREVIIRRVIFVKPNNTGTTVVRSEMFKKSYFPSRMHR